MQQLVSLAVRAYYFIKFLVILKLVSSTPCRITICSLITSKPTFSKNGLAVLLTSDFNSVCPAYIAAFSMCS